MKTGLVSVTFRKLSVEEIISIAVTAEIDCIEWGSDIHCPVGDITNTQKVCALMQQNNLETISYGSYYRVGEHDNFADVLTTAVALKAPNIRVWAGGLDSENATADYRESVISDAKRIAEVASKNDITISFEYHGDTLTNTQQSTIKLLKEIDSDNVFTYWQPLANTTFEQNKKNIHELIACKKLMNIHAYHWQGGDKLSLADGKTIWNEYIKITNNAVNAVLIEFVKKDSTQQFLQDAKTLKELIRWASSPIQTTLTF